MDLAGLGRARLAEIVVTRQGTVLLESGNSKGTDIVVSCSERPTHQGSQSAIDLLRGVIVMSSSNETGAKSHIQAFKCANKYRIGRKNRPSYKSCGKNTL